MTDPRTAGYLLLAYLDAVPTERLLYSGVSREDLQQRQERADTIRQQIKDLAAQSGDGRPEGEA